MTKTLTDFINHLNKSDNKHWCILYEPGMRGNVVQRILSSHEEVWWDNKIMNINSDPTISLPLQFSEKQTSFIPVDGANFKHTFLAPHSCTMLHKSNDVVDQLLKIRKHHLDKYFFSITHPEYLNGVMPDKYIYLYASMQNSKRYYKSRSPSTDKNALNIDISKLFSYNREQFEDEYIKIINIFELSPMFTSVRNFILQLLDREQVIKNNELYTPNF